LMLQDEILPRTRERLPVVRRSLGYGSCERCGEAVGDGLTRCRGCGTVYESATKGGV
jgi:RNA polymerase-binding transcription factor DksA